MKVFVIGASGYIGFNAACAFRRGGHEVWGLVRREEKAQSLRESEIQPVIGAMETPAGYQQIAARCSLLVYCAFDPQQGFAVERSTMERLLSLARLGAQPKTVIYTSGVWVHGDTGGALVDETAAPTPPKLVASRPATEQLIMGANDVRTLVIRPGCVYGRKGGLTGMWFKGVQDMSLTAVGDGRNRWAMVHVDDLAQAYVLAGESGLSREVFNITDRSRATVSDMVEAVRRVTGYAGEIRYVPVSEGAASMGDLAECLALDQHVDARKAVRLLGWQPRHGGFADEAQVHYEAWKAAQSTL